MSGARRWEAVVTARSSVSHGGETLGRVRYLRRERLLLDGAVPVEVPVVSGNAVRGRLRDLASTLWWDDAGRPPLTLPVAHALFSGGALTKAVGEPLSGQRLRELKALCPPIAVFGAAGGGRILDGALNVGKMIPVCAETAPLLPAVLRDGPLPGLWDLTQIEWFSRHPDRTLPDGRPLDGTEPDRYGMETFLPGTRFHWWLALDRADERTAGFFEDVLAAYCADPRAGGGARTGHGQLEVVLDPPVSPDAQAAWRRSGTPLTLDELKVLAWLD